MHLIREMLDERKKCCIITLENCKEGKDVMDRVYTIEEIKSIVAPIAAAHDVNRIYLFGSYARGEATTGSDIDLRVDKGRLKGLFALGALYADLEDGLGKQLDLFTTGSLEWEFLQNIAKDEILLYSR